jgi:hypothetical protein
VRIHSQWNSTPEGQSVSQALLPDPSVPGGGNNTDRGNFRVFACRTRINMAVQGPPTLGGETAGYIENDFSQNLSGGESGAVSPNPRLRYAYLRWAFPNISAPERLVLIGGQTDSFADYIPDTIDFNTMLAGLGASNRRNPTFRGPVLAPDQSGRERSELPSASSGRSSAARTPSPTVTSARVISASGRRYRAASASRPGIASVRDSASARSRVGCERRGPSSSNASTGGRPTRT